MKTFDDILPNLKVVLNAHKDIVQSLGPMLINRDLNGRVRLILEESQRGSLQADKIAAALDERLGIHGYGSPEHLLMFETDLESVKQGAPYFLLDGFSNVTVVDRLVTETDWSNIGKLSAGAPRLVFFSIKGGVGRSTALAATACSLARSGKRVLVLDLDLESPGLSSALLPKDRYPTYGITDWLVEDLLDNGDAVFGEMFAISDLSRDGEIFVVPAHGRVPGEYIVKLGRVWMPKIDANEVREAWSARLQRLIDKLEGEHKPDVILIDSRSGIDEIASTCVTELGATSILLFAVDGDQTWMGYDILFRHWLKTNKASTIRNQLQIVGAMVPSDEHAKEYFDSLRERAWNIFNALYDDIPANGTAGTEFNFDITDQSAPHYPWPIRWNKGFFALQSLHSRLHESDVNEVNAVFGEFIKGIQPIVNVESE